MILKIASPVTLHLCAETKVETNTAAPEPGSDASEPKSKASELSSQISELNSEAPEFRSFANCISGRPAAVRRGANRRAAVLPSPEGLRLKIKEIDSSQNHQSDENAKSTKIN